MASEHFIFAEEPAWGDWTTPNIGLPVRSAGINPETTFMEPGVTGGGKGRRPGTAGEIAVNGPMETLLYPVDLGFLVRTVFGARLSDTNSPASVALTSAAVGTPTLITSGAPHLLANGTQVTIAGVTGATPVVNGTHVVTVLSPTTFTVPVSVTVAGSGGTVTAAPSVTNKLLPDDDLDNGSVSIQKRYAVDLAESIKGAKINTMTIAARSREYVTAAFEFAAKDAAATGGTFSDLDPAPAPVDPVPYSPGLPDGFKFYQAEMLIGGTATLVDGALEVSGGTARCEIDNIELEANFNLATDAYGICLDDRTVQSIDDGLRELTLRFDPNFATVGFEFYNAWRNGTPAVIVMHFISGVYEITITLPYVVYQDAPNPELNSEMGLKRMTVEGGAYVDPTLLVDWGWVWTTTDDLAA